MSSFLKRPENAMKNRRIPNAFMLFVKEQKEQFMPKCPEVKSALGALLGKKWRSLPTEEKQVYFDKYEASKKSGKLEINNIDSKFSPSEDLIDLTEGDGLKKLPQESEMNEIPTDANPNVAAVGADQVVTKDKNKKKAGELISSGGNKKCKADSMSSSTAGDSLANQLSKQKPPKKVRRPPNAFMLFAREQRYTLDPDYVKGTKSHASTILGNMWKDLPNSEKEKYYHEARRLFNLYKKPDTASSPNEDKTKKKKTKMHFKKISKKPVGRPSKKIKELLPAPLPTLRSQTANSLERKTETETDPQKSLENEGNNGSVSAPFEPSQALNDYPNPSYHHSHSNVVSSHFHRMSSAIECTHSKACHCQRALHTTDYNSEVNLRQQSMADGGLHRSCFSSGFAPPFFPAYPFNTSSLWMYHQAMAHQMYSFPPPSFSHSYCSCSSPYQFYPNTYFSSYFGGRCNDVFSNTIQPSASATTASSCSKEETVDKTEKEDNSDDELLIVDESNGGDEEKRVENGTGQDK